ncbi:MAG TPA: hypothetical protein VF614_02790 [Chthoniobacteraceae bacterium]
MFLQNISRNPEKVDLSRTAEIFCKNAFGKRLSSRVNNEFKTLTDFLGQFDAEVSGRHLPEPEKKAADLLSRFANGKCDEAEREAACQMLHLHPAWIRWVADRVKLARETVDTADRS